MKENDSRPNETQKKSGAPQLGHEEVFNPSTVILHRNNSGGDVGITKPCVRSASHLFNGNNRCFRHGPPVLFGDASESFHSLDGAS